MNAHMAIGGLFPSERREEFQQRIIERSVPVPWTGCWLWLGKVHGSGYGWAKIGRKPYGAHRISYEAFIGRIPDGKLICHKCDVRSCVNPTHLFPGSCADNAQDMVRKGRWRR